MPGDLARSRALANRAIQADPDYPLNYYNLACADAEEGKNTLPGESMPDPTQDDSIMKLKPDRAFWSFVENSRKNR